MTRLALEFIEARAAAHAPARVEAGAASRQAAVAAILRKGEPDTEALFILRATKEGDPWSGHMAFPGGHLDPGDESLRAAAERETLEEIGLDLTNDARFVGELDHVRANPRGRNIDMVVTPFIYVLRNPDPALRPNYEVADILWGSLNDMYLGNSLTRGEFEVGGQRLSYPGYAVGEHIVWGLTLRVLDHFFSMLDPDWDKRYE
jgi:8-oxo-dGTP pyrophosphatase MutT (NUDIX family)